MQPKVINYNEEKSCSGACVIERSLVLPDKYAKPYFQGFSNPKTQRSLQTLMMYMNRQPPSKHDVRASECL